MSDDDTLPEHRTPADAARAETLKRMDRDVEVEVFDAVRAPDDANPVTPIRLKGGDTFCFKCHKDVPCWNQCCHGADITLTPNDILRMCARLEVRPEELLVTYTVPAIWEKADMPVAKLKMGGDDGKGPCPFVSDDGCTIYSDRPATCRYYPLGLVSIKIKESDEKENFHFLVREEHCKGHDEKREISVEEFRDEQEVIEFERVNRGWMDTLMKSASWRPTGGIFGTKVPQATKQMFFMVSTDVDALRRFVLGTKFLEVYDVDPEAVEVLKTDDDVLLKLGFDWIQHVMFREPTITLKQDVLQQAIAKARDDVGGI
jgi:uncharacterized protein